MSGTRIKEQVLKYEMLLLLSWCSYYLENYMGFKSSGQEPETEINTYIFYHFTTCNVYLMNCIL